MCPEILEHNPNSFESIFNDSFREWAIEHLSTVTGIDPHEFPPLSDQELWEGIKTIGSNSPFNFDESRLTLGQCLAVSIGILLDTDQLPEGDCLMDIFNRLPTEHGFSVPYMDSNENTNFLGNIALALGAALGFHALKEFCPPPVSDEELKELIEASSEELESLRSS